MLGSGAYAIIKEAIHIKTGKYYGCKVINEKLMEGREHMASTFPLLQIGLVSYKHLVMCLCTLSVRRGGWSFHSECPLCGHRQPLCSHPVRSRSVQRQSFNSQFLDSRLVRSSV